MTLRRVHRRLAALLLLGAALAVAPPVPAGGQTDVGGGSGPDGVTIRIVRFRGTDRVHVGGEGASDGCRYELADFSLRPGGGPPADPDQSRWRILLCNGSPERWVLVGPGNVVDLEVEARRQVEEYVRTIPVPVLEVNINPPGTGLTGLESWFWASGYSGGVVTHRIEVFDVAVDVRIAPTGVTWEFGDGASVHGDLGRPYPARSTITHVYTHRSTYDVEASMALRPSYRVDGTEWQYLADIPVGGEASYPVDEVQAVITTG